MAGICRADMVKLLQTFFKTKLCPEHHQESRHRKDKGKTDSHVQTEPGFSSLGGQETSARVELGRIVTLCQTNCYRRDKGQNKTRRLREPNYFNAMKIFSVG